MKLNPKPTSEQIWLRSILRKNSKTITDLELEQLADFSRLLRHWNKKINLISRRDEGRIWTNHILLSLAFDLELRFIDGQQILDLGTGGGLPGIPLAIILPGVHFTLVDSIQKKTTAVKSITAALGLENIRVVCSRAEELNNDLDFRHKFDVVLARGVSSLPLLIKWSFPFLRKGTTVGEGSKHSRPLLATLKGGELDKELVASQRLFPAAVFRVIALTFAGSEPLPSIEKKLIVVNPEENP